MCLYSIIFLLQVRFDYHLAHQGPVALSQECEANSLASNAHEHYCWIEYRCDIPDSAYCRTVFVLWYFNTPTTIRDYVCRKGSIVTPLAEFERAVLSSMALMGRKTLPHYSPIDMIETGEVRDCHRELDIYLS